MITSKNAGEGRIIIPSNTEREDYIRRCYDTGRVSLFTYGAGIIRQVSVCKHCWNDIVFPETYEEYGSAVLYVKIPNREEYVVHGILPEMTEAGELSEDQFFVGRSREDGIAAIAGDAKGSLNITVSNTTTGGTVTINVGNRSKDGKLEMSVVGAILAAAKTMTMTASDQLSIMIPKTDSTDAAHIKYVRTEGFSFLDEHGNTISTKKDLVEINGGDNGGLVIVGKASGQYNKIEDDINNLKNILSAWTPVNQDGGAALKGALGAWYGQQLSRTKASDIENKKVTH